MRSLCVRLLLAFHPSFVVRSVSNLWTVVVCTFPVKLTFPVKQLNAKPLCRKLNCIYLKVSGNSWLSWFPPTQRIKSDPILPYATEETFWLPWGTELPEPNDILFAYHPPVLWPSWSNVGRVLHSWWAPHSLTDHMPYPTSLLRWKCNHLCCVIGVWWEQVTPFLSGWSEPLAYRKFWILCS